jgi:hypothetical protein
MPPSAHQSCYENAIARQLVQWTTEKDFALWMVRNVLCSQFPHFDPLPAPALPGEPLSQPIALQLEHTLTAFFE